MQAYLQLPPDGVGLKELASRITSHENNNYERAISIKGFILTNYKYKMTLRVSSGWYPLEEFLVNKEEGHCEYFATAMAVLLREVGVPSKIVNGFIGGEINEQGNSYLIRESDAYSWVEAYFPGYGWVSFDPTPESGRSCDGDSLSGACVYCR